MPANRPIAEATTVVLASATEDGAGPGGDVARWVADALGIPHHVLHLDEQIDDAEEMAASIADRLPSDAVLVMESHHADRWASRRSIAEHVLDAFGGPAVVAGPAVVGPPAGPIVVALDGSDEANQALGPALTLSQATDRSIVLATVVADPLDGTPDLAGADAMLSAVASDLPADVEHQWVSRASNDPVTALADIAAEADACLVVMVSKGDRTIARASMSRTATGLVATTACPVVIVSAG